MNNILLNISAAALQKQLEQEANSGSSADRGDLDLKVQEERTSSSLLSHLTGWIADVKTVRSHAVTSKLKNKIV
jgi:hypothetical protein